MVWSTAVNRWNRRKVKQAKEADRLGPKGRWSGLGAPNSPSAAVASPAERRDLPHPGTPMERGKPVAVPLGRYRVSDTYATAGTGRGRKRRPCCHSMDRGGLSPHAQAGRLPSGLSARKPLVTRLRRQSRGRQLRAAGAVAHGNVCRPQASIVQACHVVDTPRSTRGVWRGLSGMRGNMPVPF